MNYILYNPISGCGKSEENARKIELEKSECVLVNITSIESYEEFFKSKSPSDEITVCGGDGTLNRFINGVSDIAFENRIFYYPSGTGNDFYADIAESHSDMPVDITEYIKKLPTVTVNGNKYKFINDDYFEELENILIMADIGVDTVMNFVDKLKVRVTYIHLETEPLKAMLQ